MKAESKEGSIVVKPIHYKELIKYLEWQIRSLTKQLDTTTDKNMYARMNYQKNVHLSLKKIVEAERDRDVWVRL